MGRAGGCAGGGWRRRTECGGESTPASSTPCEKFEIEREKVAVYVTVVAPAEHSSQPASAAIWKPPSRSGRETLPGAHLRSRCGSVSEARRGSLEMDWARRTAASITLRNVRRDYKVAWLEGRRRCWLRLRGRRGRRSGREAGRGWRAGMPARACGRREQRRRRRLRCGGGQRRREGGRRRRGRRRQGGGGGVGNARSGWRKRRRWRRSRGRRRSTGDLYGDVPPHGSSDISRVVVASGAVYAERSQGLGGLALGALTTTVTW